ncbi:hypothetical protein OB919_15810 [Halobacteria archaeon AArc-curdl1]|uniref:Uncharacterized protein n=1 Tax=Natronosalvus hydrolyticus TaxID=2979988 RepID=A0AAP3E800_9EURY|nr:hypothetical protein [Halobacteria archaeon AArc-curdl1]
MSYEILFTEEHREQVVRYHSEEVADQLEKRLETKQRQLELISEQNQLGQRFHNFFGYKGIHVAEASFKAHRNQYRALLILVGSFEDNYLVFYKVVEKEDRYESSQQWKTWRSVVENPSQIKKKAKDWVLEEMDL